MDIRSVSRLRKAHKDRGQSTIELALCAIVFFTVLAGVFDIGRGVWYFTTMESAAREATRYAIVHGSKSSSPSGPGNTSALNTVVNKYAGSGLNTSKLTITPSYPDGNNAPGSRVTVMVTYPFQPFMVKGIATFTISASSTRYIVF
jgi:Flp pilus assembly protein TadG